MGISQFVDGAKSEHWERLVPVSESEVIPIVDFFRPPIMSQPRLNPDGTHLAALSSGGSAHFKLVVFEIDSGESWVVSTPRNLEVFDFQWLDSDRITLSASHRGQGGGGLLVVDLKGRGRPYPLIQNAGYKAMESSLERPHDLLAWVMAFEVTNKRGEIVVLNTERDGGRWVDMLNLTEEKFENVQRLNRRAIREKVTFLNEGEAQKYYSDGNGGLAYGIVTEEGLLSLHAWNGKKWTRSPADLETMTVHGVGVESGQVIVSVHNYDGTVSPVHLMDAATGKLGPEILRDAAYDFTGSLVRDSGTRRIVGLRYDRAMPAFVWFDEEYQNLHATLKGRFPKKVVEIVSSDDSANVFVLAVRDDRSPVSYHIANLEKGSLGRLMVSRPWLDPKRLGRVSVMKFKTVDGLRLDSFVTLPEGASTETKVPLVVLPHSGWNFWGRWSRDRFGYDEIAQFLASRGYGVLQPNYRGTPGTRWMFPEADQWDWRKMSDDVTRATKTVLKTRLFDTSRIAIMGEGLGAQLALAGAVHEPDLYSCVVGMDGFYDWEQVMTAIQSDVGSNGNYSRLALKMGSEEQDPEKFRLQSPSNFLDQMKAPMLVAHGRYTPHPTLRESQRLIRALKKADVEYDSIFTDREGWGGFDLENRLKVYERIESFLAEHL